MGGFSNSKVKVWEERGREFMEWVGELRKNTEVTKASQNETMWRVSSKSDNGKVFKNEGESIGGEEVNRGGREFREKMQTA